MISLEAKFSTQGSNFFLRCVKTYLAWHFPVGCTSEKSISLTMSILIYAHYITPEFFVWFLIEGVILNLRTKDFQDSDLKKKKSDPEFPSYLKKKKMIWLYDIFD